ncbi:MAG: hypothetical protein WA979_01070 [Pacificimonas sp.]
MEDGANTFAPPLPLAALGPGLLCSLGLLWILLHRIQGRATPFLIAAIMLRVLFDAAPAYSIRPLVAGLTANALLSVATAGIGFLLIDRRLLALRALWPLYLLVFAIVLSAALNGPDAAALQVLVKMAYFAVLTLTALQAFQENGAALTMKLVAAAFAPALLFLLLSLATGTANESPTDGSRAFIGGFNHESIFSLVLAAMLLALCFATDMRRGLRLLAMIAVIGGLALANYRTVIIGLAPLLLIETFAAIMTSMPRRQRALPLLAAFGLFAIGAGTILIDPGERFEAAVDMVTNPAELIRPPEQFTLEERRFASARAYVWSQYWYGFTGGTTAEKTFGNGADSWEGQFKVYAQNTFLSYLYEFGIFGTVAVMLLLIGMAFPAFAARGLMKWRLLAAHAGFLLVNLSTMPFWIIEGLIFYALLFALSLHYGQRGRTSTER